MSEVLRVFIGYDRHEHDAYEVCKMSLLAHASKPILVTKLDVEMLQACGLYRRPFWVDDDGQSWDGVDGSPFSTEFSFSRFLVPALCLWEGWALYCDSDFLWRDDVAKLFALRESRKAVQVVRHNYNPTETVKMRGGKRNEGYPKKNWSSLMLFNTKHPSCRALSTWQINFLWGYRLHQFEWVGEGDDAIGGLPAEWNWLEGISDPTMTPKAVHFTRGTPDIPEYAETAFSDEWWAWRSKVGAPNAA